MIKNKNIPIYLMGAIMLVLFYPMWINNPIIAAAIIAAAIIDAEYITAAAIIIATTASIIVVTTAIFIYSVADIIGLGDDTCVIVIIFTIISIFFINIVITELIRFNKYKILYFIQIIILILFFILSVSVFSYSDYTELKNDKETIILKKGDIKFFTFMEYNINRYNKESKTIHYEKNGWNIEIAISEKASSFSELLEAKKDFKNFDIKIIEKNLDPENKDLRKEILGILEKEYPKINTNIKKLKYNPYHPIKG